MAYMTTIQYQDVTGRNVSYDLIFRLSIDQLLDFDPGFWNELQNISSAKGLKDGLRKFVSTCIGFPEEASGFTGFRPMTENEKEFFFNSDGWDLLFMEITSGEDSVTKFMRSVMPNRDILEKMFRNNKEHNTSLDMHDADNALDALYGPKAPASTESINPFQK